MLSLEVTGAFGQTTLAHRFRESGKNLLLFIHGLGCSKEVFDGAWDEKCLNDYSLLSIDLLGFGSSPKPENFPYTMEAQGEIVVQVIDAFPKYRIHFVGNSMGPILGMCMPSRVTAFLASFINIEARLLREDCGNSAKAAALSYEEFLKSYWPALQKNVRKLSRTAYDLDHASPRAFYLGAKSVVSLAESGWSLQNYLALPVPTIYFYGDDPASVNMRVLKLLKGKVPLKQISKCGHFMMLDNPEAFYRALGKFIEKVRR
jgi:pimeloyl-ACP methyl ester carboxylesterase